MRLTTGALVMQSAAREAFLTGQRARGIRHSWAAVRTGVVSLKLVATVALGMLGPRALANAKLGKRRVGAWRSAARG
jgi:hypothetical protein